MPINDLLGLVLGISLLAGAVLLLLARWFDFGAGNRWFEPSTIFSVIVFITVVAGLLVPHS